MKVMTLQTLSENIDKVNKLLEDNSIKINEPMLSKVDLNTIKQFTDTLMIDSNKVNENIVPYITKTTFNRNLRRILYIVQQRNLLKDVLNNWSNYEDFDYSDDDNNTDIVNMLRKQSNEFDYYFNYSRYFCPNQEYKEYLNYLNTHDLTNEEILKYFKNSNISNLNMYHPDEVNHYVLSPFYYNSHNEYNMISKNDIEEIIDTAINQLKNTLIVFVDNSDEVNNTLNEVNKVNDLM